MSKETFLTVTKCFQRHLKSLYLNEFPCVKDTQCVEKYDRKKPSKLLIF